MFSFNILVGFGFSQEFFNDNHMRILVIVAAESVERVYAMLFVFVNDCIRITTSI
jgi:hypothetical protein